MSQISDMPSPRRSEDGNGHTEFHAPVYGPRKARKKFVLCFDGTGNKFQGDDSDSNILKIYRMLDRGVDNQYHYYQPGIGTYTTTGGLSHTSVKARVSSWYQKAKDSAVGTSFDAHVMAGYKFLMQWYTPGDDIYFFGFSRGAYIARFLAEMLDYVGLLSAGNEELCRFAWKTFSQWQQRQNDTEEEKEKTRKLFKFMKGFRDTFSRPVKRIRFLGLFDTVNSVPRFESAWMQRSKFPYTARSSAKMIRHAVGIDERRAKFRQDLISQPGADSNDRHHHHQHVYRQALGLGMRNHKGERHGSAPKAKESTEKTEKPNGGMKRTDSQAFQRFRGNRPRNSRQGGISNRDRSRSRASQGGLAADQAPIDTDSISIERAAAQLIHADTPDSDSDSDDDTEAKQDLAEVWFPGCHADIGGGWGLGDGESYALSHAPLVWMVREASRAGIEFDPDKMEELCCCEEESFFYARQRAQSGVPEIREPGQSPSGDGDAPAAPTESRYVRALQESATTGRIHDCLALNNGLPTSSVISWNIMEYLPFRRMDLREDGSWKPIRWPLPMGEVRDIPDKAWVHNSVLKRMAANENYRPGNILVGGGGRGTRTAPPEFGTGDWEVLREEGDPVGEVLVKKNKSGEAPKSLKNGTH